MSGCTLSFISCSAFIVLLLPITIICATSTNQELTGGVKPQALTTQPISPKDIQCGNNFNTYPMENGTASCTNYGRVQYQCEMSSCYVGNNPQDLASSQLYFYDCARLGVEELLPKILAIRYKASNLVGALEIMDENGQEYGCRWRKPNENGNVRVSCKKCRLRSFPNPLKPQPIDFEYSSAHSGL